MIQDIEFQYKLRNLSSSSRPGAHPSFVRGPGMVFHKVVPLINYPDPRRLDIKSSLLDPFGQWLVREFKQRSSLPVLAIVDLSSSLAFQGNESGLSVLLKFLNSLYRSTHRYGDRLGLIGFDNSFRNDWYFPPIRKRSLDESTIEKLIRDFKPVRGHNGIREVDSWLPKEQSLVFLVSDFHWSMKNFENFLIKSSKHQVVPVLLEDSVEKGGYYSRGFSYLSDSETAKKKLVWLNEEFIRKVDENYKKKIKKFSSICSKYDTSPLIIKGEFDPKKVTSYFFGDGE